MKGFTVIDLVHTDRISGSSFVRRVLHFSKGKMKGKESCYDGTIPWWVTSVSIFATLLSPFFQPLLITCGNSYGGTWILWLPS